MRNSSVYPGNVKHGGGNLTNGPPPHLLPITLDALVHNDEG